MRVVYSTPRLENAERVSSLLEAAGVGNRVLYGPQHRKRSWRAADYRQQRDPGNWPRVLVLNNGDLPEARRLLREAGLIAPAAFQHESEDSLTFATRPEPGRPARRVLTPGRIRTGLIVVVLVLALIQALRHFG